MGATRRKLATVAGSAALLVLGWFILDDGVSSASPTKVPDPPSPGPSVPAPTHAEPTPAARWQALRAEIVRAQPKAGSVRAEAPAAGAGDHLPTLGEAKAAQQAAFQLCTEDWSSHSIGVLTLRSRVLGAPDVGTIYESVDVVTDLDNADGVIECLRESMYAFTGSAPPRAFNQTLTVTTLGRRPDGMDDTEWHDTMFRAVAGAYVGDLEACMALSDAKEGQVELELVFGEEPSPDEVTILSTTLPDMVAQCVADEARSWRFPRNLKGPHRYLVELPVLEPIE